MKTLIIKTGSHSYPVYTGENLLDKKDYLSAHINGNSVVIVTNEIIAPLYLERLKSKLTSYQTKQIILPDGEQWKNLDTLSKIFNTLMEHKCDRKTTLIALGGGVVGDITGFAAACYRRGVPVIQIPTTLLAQVDSSIGGKTGINHPLGKNMIGAFWQPQCVLADLSMLKTLPQREFIAGLAEVIKYGLISDQPFYQWLHENIDGLILKDASLLAYAVHRSCKNKAAVVAEDEKEQGRRAILNFGHTFAHAIEAAQNYKGLLHGEAVAVGMMMAADYSCRLNFLLEKEKTLLEKLLVKTGLPVSIPDNVERTHYVDMMSQDKKTDAGQLNLIVLKRPGGAIKCRVNNDKLNATLDAFFGVLS